MLRRLMLFSVSSKDGYYDVFGEALFYPDTITWPPLQRGCLVRGSLWSYCV